MVNDAHCHFFSPRFIAALAAQRQRNPVQSIAEICRELEWDEPGTPEALADRWTRAMDEHGVGRTVLIASAPGDEESVGAAVARHPERFVGYFMLDPSAPDAADRARRAVTELNLRGICLFPAMHHVGLDDDRVARVVEVAAGYPQTVVFVHCGLLSIGVRRKLGLPSRFDLRLGNPLTLSRLALAFPTVRFIVPHFGAGMLRELLMTAAVCPNVYADTSSSNSWIRHTPGLSLEAVFSTALSVLGPARILFGTDSSFFPRGWQAGIYEEQMRVVDALGLNPADRASIFGRNFDAMFS